MTTHQFANSLEYSHSQTDAPWWEPVYRKAFPRFAHMQDVRHDGWHQRAGIDRVVLLSDSRTILVDEKVRRETWPDILLEVWSDQARKEPGWAVKPLRCDYLAYAMVPSETCYLLPFLLMQQALKDNYEQWSHAATSDVEGFRWVEAHNHEQGRGWRTRSIAVPTEVLLRAISDAMVIRWSA